MARGEGVIAGFVRATEKTRRRHGMAMASRHKRAPRCVVNCQSVTSPRRERLTLVHSRVYSNNPTPTQELSSLM
jgi:hypothetical protein